jgi:hypothetical protein
MELVLNQRKALFTALLGIAITVHYLVFDMVLPTLPGGTDGSKLIKFLLSGGLLYSSIVIAPLWWYDRALWRILNPRYDITGVWEVNLYELEPFNKAHVTDAGIEAAGPYVKRLQDNTGIALITQSPFRASVQEATAYSPAGEFTGWTAEIVCVDLPGQLSVVFEYPAAGDFSGRDFLTVYKRDWRDRPSELLGDAYHVVRHLQIAIKGKIRYRRLTRAELTEKLKDVDARRKSLSKLEKA